MNCALQCAADHQPDHNKIGAYGCCLYKTEWSEKDFKRIALGGVYYKNKKNK